MWPKRLWRVFIGIGMLKDTMDGKIGKIDGDLEIFDHVAAANRTISKVSDKKYSQF